MWLCSTACCTAVSALLVVVLRFDGSLRPPKEGDPGYPCALSKKCASCAASLSKKEERTGKEIPWALGGRALSHETCTSAHAEYQGLLLGLEWLLVDDHHLPENGTVLIIIEGDCRTVMDQLAGRSTPRKLRSLHNQAMSYLEAIAVKCGAETSVEFRHISRDLNGVCDHVAGEIIASKSAARVHDLKNAIAREGRVGDLLDEYFEPTTSLVPYSERFQWAYQELAKLAHRQSDHAGLVSIGSRMEEDCRLLGSNDNNNKWTLLKAALAYQIQGLEGLGEQSKADRLARRQWHVSKKKELPRSDAIPAPQVDNLETIHSSWTPLIAQWKAATATTDWNADTAKWVSSPRASQIN